jgi:FkbM family methyltransferase
VATGESRRGRLVIDALGVTARAARGAGLGGALATSRDAADRLCSRVGRPPLRAETDGFALRGYLRHRSFLSEVARGTKGGYRHLFREAVTPGTIVCDGGAHLGLYTVLGSRLAETSGRVLAFEPDSYNLRALRWNVEHAGIGNVTVVPKALADVRGVALFRENSGTISSSLAAREGVGTESLREVELTSIDDDLDGVPIGRLVVKLNVEGAEPLALRGMQRSLERAESVRLFVEINPPALIASGTSAEDVLGELHTLGMDVSRIDPVNESLGRIGPGAQLHKMHVYCARS